MAAGIFDTTIPLTSHNDYTESLILLKPEELVLLNHLKRTYPGIKDAKAWKRSNELQGRQIKSYEAIAEGTDKTDGFAHRNNTIVESIIEVGQSNGYAITREQLILNRSHVKHNYLDELIDNDAADFARSIEHVIGSRQECVDKTSPTVVTKTRGLMSWLQPGAHTVLPIADGFRPATEIALGKDDTLTEAVLKEALVAARKNAGHALNLVGFVGLDAKLAFADFLGKIPVQRNMDAKDTTIFSMVDFFKYDAANLKLVQLDGLDCDPTTLEPTNASGFSGAFIELDNFQLEFAQQITHEDLSTKTDKGSGKKGMHRAMFRLNCTGLLGSFRMTKSLT